MEQGSRRALAPYLEILPPMSDLPQETSLLAELDRRQDEVLAQLNELNERVERLLEESLAARNAELELEELQMLRGRQAA
jgi:hypothetical protein